MNKLPFVFACPHRGAALIVAMLIAALAAAVAVTLIVSEQRWLAGVEAQRDHAQAQALADAGVQWARHILFQDARRGGDIDHLKESWAYPLPPTPIENGSIEGRIVDLQSRFNLNNLLPASNSKRADYERLNHLCARLELGDNVRQALFSYYSVAAGTDDNSAFAAGSVTLPPLFDPSDLALPAAAMTKLAPYLTALPEPAPLNVNTADRDTLKTLFTDIGDDDLNKLLAERDSRPFHSIADFRRRLPPDARPPSEEGLGVGSRYFMISVRARQGDARAQAQAVLRRDGKRWPEIVWKTVE